MRIGAGDIRLVETVVGRKLTRLGGPGAIYDDVASNADEIGAGLVDTPGSVALPRDEPAETFLDEIADILKRRAAAQVACQRRLVRGVDCLHARPICETRPIVGRDRIALPWSAPARLFFVKIHAFPPSGRTEAAMNAGR
ncbi:MAG: hypothetical protein JHD35_00745 [Sphingopyxis sp.]|nr:hypothetical protein [Sphingopyxis sp.]